MDPIGCDWPSASAGGAMAAGSAGGAMAAAPVIVDDPAKTVVREFLRFRRKRMDPMECDLARMPFADPGGAILSESQLRRLFNRENNPEAVRDTGMLILTPLFDRGPGETVLRNFLDFCKRIRRHHRSITSFLACKLETDICLDFRRRLIIYGEFSEEHIRGVFERYIRDYVLCLECNNLDTIFLEEGRFLKCDKCGSERYFGSDLHPEIWAKPNAET